jgi:hypothetical protein
MPESALPGRLPAVCDASNGQQEGLCYAGRIKENRTVRPAMGHTNFRNLFKKHR